jgi:hypothetical protein
MIYCWRFLNSPKTLEKNAGIKLFNKYAALSEEEECEMKGTFFF